MPSREAPQPRPLRVIATTTSAITLIIGGLPTVGVPLSAAQAGWIVGAVGALAAIAVALLGENAVTPVSSPRDDTGTPLVPASAVNRDRYHPPTGGPTD